MTEAEKNQSPESSAEEIDIETKPLYHHENLWGFDFNGDIVISIDAVCDWLSLDKDKKIKEITEDPILSLEAACMIVEDNKGNIKRPLCMAYLRALGWVYSNLPEKMANPQSAEKIYTLFAALSYAPLIHFMESNAQEKKDIIQHTFSFEPSRAWHEFENNLHTGE